MTDPSDTTPEPIEPDLFEVPGPDPIEVMHTLGQERSGSGGIRAVCSCAEFEHTTWSAGSFARAAIASAFNDHLTTVRVEAETP